jgi:hypothetical protein
MDGLVVFRSFQWIWNRLFPKDPPMFRKDPSVDVTSGWALHPFHFGSRFQAANMNSYSELRRLTMTFPRHMTEFLCLVVFNSFDGIFLGPSTFRCPQFQGMARPTSVWRYMIVHVTDICNLSRNLHLQHGPTISLSMLIKLPNENPTKIPPIFCRWTWRLSHDVKKSPFFSG